MAAMRRPGPVNDTSGMLFDPTAQPKLSYEAYPGQTAGGEPPATDYAPPNGNTGISGYAPGGTPPPSPVQGGTGTMTPAPTGSGSGAYAMGQRPAMEGFEQSKMGTGHSTKSPKYAFADAVASGQYGKQDGSRLLADLQAQYPDFFKGVQVKNDKFTGMTGDVWNGVTEIDWYRDFDGADGPGAFQWGASGGIADGPGGAQSGTPGGLQAGSGGGGYNFDDIKGRLASLFDSGGGFNQDVVNRRTENAAQDLRRFSDGRQANNRAMMAERGLMGSGVEGTEAFSREEDIADRYAQAVSGIYADESENADSRMMEALSLATGMSIEEAAQAVQMFNAQTGRMDANNRFTLGQGGLAVDNFRAQNDYNLGLGNFGLDRERLMHDMETGDTDAMIRILQLLLGGANTSAGGHI
jgi:hypothetical protein